MDSDKGQVVAWFDDKGYGFVRPDKLGADLFLHVKELLPHLRRPRVGDRVAYTIVGSETDKPRAARVAISGFAWSSSATACAGLFALSLVYAAFACSGQIPFHPAAAAYLAMSVLTFCAYLQDKRAAIAGGRRTPEASLHLLELLGGWPGALLAQLAFRHKLRKASFQIALGLIITAHAALWLASPRAFALPFKRLCSSASELIAGSGATFLAGARAARSAEAIPAADPIARMPAPAASVPQDDPLGGWEREPPAEPLIVEPAAYRSRLRFQGRNRQAVGVVLALSKSKGVLVSLPREIGEAGVIPSSTLIPDFQRRFRVGERVRVAITGVTQSGNKPQINLLLVEDRASATGSPQTWSTP
jgi:uncharacterized membrane protein YsdA (DUF1294 family)/cold shock CspA family protein